MKRLPDFREALLFANIFPQAKEGDLYLSYETSSHFRWHQ